MKTIQSVPISNATYEKLFSVPCVTSVLRTGKDITVTLDASLTKGSLRASSGDYLVQFASGLWQRFGPEAWQKLLHNPPER